MKTSYSGPRKDNMSSFLRRVSIILDISEHEVRHILVNPPFKTFRINRLKHKQTAGKIVEVFENQNIRIRPLGWYPDAYIFDAEDTAKIQASELAQNGEIFIQNASSFLPVFALQLNKNDEILDMCSAPGGKASMIASIVGSSANLFMNEPKPGRVSKLQEVVSLQGFDVINITMEDARHMSDMSSKQFDKVLIDAECSTEAGTNFLSRYPLEGWSIDKIKELSVLQKQMLTSGYDLLKPGGVLVYATCTFAPEENEAVVSSLLERRPEAIVQPLTFNSERKARKVKSWEGKGISPQVYDRVLRIFPSEYMEGFFLARIRKPSGSDSYDKKLTEPVNLDLVASL